MSRFKLVGRKRWKGTVDGKAIDSAKLFVEVQLDDSRNTADAAAAGFCVEEIRLEDSEQLRRLEHLPLPCMIEIETVRVSNGKSSRERVIDVRPVELAKPVKAAA